MSVAEKPIKRILLVRTDRLGDVILTLPMLPILRAQYPDAFIAMLLRRYTGAIIEGNPYINQLIWYDENGGEMIPLGIMRKTLAEQRFDATIVVYPTLRLAWLMFRSGIAIRIGTGYRYYSFLFNRRVFEHRKNAERHEVEYNLNLLKELGCDVRKQPEFFIEIPTETEHNVRGLLASLGVASSKPVAIVHPGTGGSARVWSSENFGKLAEKLVANSGVQVLVTGSLSEQLQAERVVRASGSSAISIAGKLSMKELAALIRMSQLFVSNSTGPIHVAAAVGTPVVGLYPQHVPMSAKRWGPYSDKSIVFTPKKPEYCADCSGGKDEQCACMQSITVNEVYAAAGGLLEPNKRIARQNA